MAVVEPFIVSQNVLAENSEIPQNSTNAPLQGAGTSLAPGESLLLDDVELGQLRLLEVNKRVVVPPKTHLRIFDSLMSRAGEASSSVPPRISLPSQEAPPQAPSPAEGKEDSFGIGVLLEPFPENETGGASLNQRTRSHQYQEPPFIPNKSLEASLKGRIETLQRGESPFLPQDKEGQFWEQVRASRDQASDQREYNLLMEFENRDLQIREQKDQCFRLLKEIVKEHPHLASDFKPEEALLDFFEEIEEELAEENGGSLLNDTQVLEIILEVKKDFLKWGVNSYYLKRFSGRLN